MAPRKIAAMVAIFSDGFRKRYRKLPRSIQQKFDERFQLFLSEPSHPLLDNHPLTAEWEGCHSINITGDYRAIYCRESLRAIQFLAIDTHHNLYGN